MFLAALIYAPRKKMIFFDLMTCTYVHLSTVTWMYPNGLLQTLLNIEYVSKGIDTDLMMEIMCYEIWSYKCWHRRLSHLNKARHCPMVNCSCVGMGIIEMDGGATWTMFLVWPAEQNVLCENDNPFNWLWLWLYVKCMQHVELVPHSVSTAIA